MTIKTPALAEEVVGPDEAAVVDCVRRVPEGDKHEASPDRHGAAIQPGTRRRMRRCGVHRP